MPFVPRFLGVALATPFLLAACQRDRSTTDRDVAGAKLEARDSTRPLGRGDIRITNTDSSFELALIGDSIVTGFGKKVLDEIKEKTDTATVTGNGLGASIEKMVKGTVANAMGHQLLFPISEIKEVRYENEHLQFIRNDGSQMHLFENSRSNGKDASTTFRADDAQRFVAAFRARKGGA